MAKYKELLKIIEDMKQKIDELQKGELIIQTEDGEVEIVSRDDVEIVSDNV